MAVTPFGVEALSERPNDLSSGLALAENERRLIAALGYIAVIDCFITISRGFDPTIQVNGAISVVCRHQ